MLDGGTVTLTLSLGVEMYDVPQVRGQSEDEAQDAIVAGNLSFGTSTERWSETVPEGVVMSSKPKAGTSVRPGAAIDLVVSKGRRPIRVGAWVGKDAEVAERVLTERGLTVVTSAEEYSDEYGSGEVISHSPSGGTVFTGDEVSLVVSLGPELVEMPGVIAFGVQAATDKLEALGFRVEVSNASEYLGLGFVFRSDPSAGELVAKGSTVVLYLI